jgi:hypothetical protein
MSDGKLSVMPYSFWQNVSTNTILYGDCKGIGNPDYRQMVENGKNIK